MQRKPTALDQLPDDNDVLKSLIAEQVARNDQLQADMQSVAQKNEQHQARVPGHIKGANDESVNEIHSSRIDRGPRQRRLCGGVGRNAQVPRCA